MMKSPQKGQSFRSNLEKLNFLKNKKSQPHYAKSSLFTPDTHGSLAKSPYSYS